MAAFGASLGVFELWVFFTDWSLGGRYALLETAIAQAEKSLALDGIQEVKDVLKGMFVHRCSVTARGKELE